MPTVFDLTTLTSDDGFAVLGAGDEDQAGYSVSDAGDVNGDGFDDFIVGAIGNEDGGGNYAGKAYVIFGRARGLLTLDLAGLTPADGFSIQGDLAGDRLGQSVSSAGDVNGDGFADIIIGAPRGDNGGTDAGEAYVIFGKASGFVNIDLAALDPADGFIIQGDGANDWAGRSVSSAGDINGDGFDDLIVGAPFAEDGATTVGEAYVIFGKASGFANIDLAALAAVDGFVITGDLADDRAGRSVSSAGDVNGDGFDDLIVGAYTGESGGLNSGQAYVIFGKDTGFTNIDLGALAATDGFLIQGSSSSDQAGISVSSAGDVNGDGYDDVIVGAHLAESVYASEGETYVIFGKASGFTTVNLAALGASDGFAIIGDALGDRSGYSVSSAGDINGDGFDEIIIGAVYADGGGSRAGAAYVVYGKASGFGTIDLAVLDPADGFIIQGDNVDDLAGNSVSGAGDIDGDGFDDLIVGARLNGVGTITGAAYVIYGSGPGDFPLLFEVTADISPASGFIIEGDVDSDNAGRSVASAGDVNGDGLDDLIVGAPLGDDGGSAAGEAYVVFGRASGPNRIDLTGLAPTDGFVIQGDSTADEAGRSVSSAGDFNGDGFDDLVVGAHLDDAGGGNAGAAYVVFGKASGFATVDLTGIAATDGFMIQGDAGGDNAGFSVSTAGDVNNDGFGDIIIGARIGDDGGLDSGEAYVLFGKASGFATIDLTGLAPADGFIIKGDFNGDRAGWAVSTAGDVNGDGFDDLIVGAPYNDDGGNLAGEAYVVFGKASGFTTVDLTGLAATDGFAIQGDEIGDQAGFSVSSAGDVNGDGFDDIVIGAQHADAGGTDSGEAYVIFGKASGFATIDLTGLALADGFAIQGAAQDDFAGYSVAGAGDVNGDGFDDILVGASGAEGGFIDSGEAYLIFGKASGFATIDLANFTVADGFIIRSDAAYDSAGRSVAAAGDVDGDGFDDLIVGGPFGEAGEAYVIFGRQPTTAVTRNGAAADQTIRGGDYDDVLNGLDGDDRLFGAGGNDTLDGGAAADTLTGGTGNDSYFVDTQADVVAEAIGEGTSDRVNANVSYVLAAGVEVEVLSTVSTSGTTAINLTGNEFANALIGNAGANVLDGGTGIDNMTGLGGNDWYFVDNLADIAAENLNSAIGGTLDRVFARVSYVLAAGTGIEVLSTASNSGTDAINLTGNELANALIGNAGANVLDGGTGVDNMTGLGGNDWYFVDNLADIAAENVNSAIGGTQDRVFARVSYVLAAGTGIETLSTASNSGTTAINLTGNEFANALIGNAGVNILDGGTGVDNMTGLGGNDSYYVDAAADIVAEDVNSAVGGTLDRVYARASYTLAAGTGIETLSTSSNGGTDAINLTGNELAQSVLGNAGANVLNGKAGKDAINGYGGADIFVFDTALDTAPGVAWAAMASTANVDNLSDFSVADDTIHLDDAIFAGLALGTLSAGAFNTGAAATDADDRIIYDTATGALIFDPDGSAGAATVFQFAVVAPGLALTNADFVVI